MLTLVSLASFSPATDYQRIANLDHENEVKPPSHVSPTVGAAIAKARQEKKDANGKSMTQKDLATKINEKPQVVSVACPLWLIHVSLSARIPLIRLFTFVDLFCIPFSESLRLATMKQAELCPTLLFWQKWNELLVSSSEVTPS